MASKKEAKVRFTADTKGFSDAIKQANSTLTMLRSELKLNASEAKSTGASIDNLAQRHQILTQEMQAQQSKIDALTSKLEAAKQAFGDSSPEVQKLQTQLNNATTAYQSMEREAEGVASAMREQEAAAAEAASAYNRLQSEINQQESELSSLKSAYRNVALEQGETSDEARELASQIQRTSSELNDNKAKLKQAEKAADGFDKSLDEVGDSAREMGNDLDAAGVALGNFAADMAGRAIDAMVDMKDEVMEASDALDKFESTMGFAGFDDSAIQSAKSTMKEYADQTVYDLNTIMNTTAQLAANGIPNYTDLTKAAGNLTAAAGGGADAFESVAMMLTQTAGAGKLTTENWNQLADAIPGASGVMQEAMLKNGAYTGNFREAMEKGEITADEFNQAIMDLGNQPVAVEAAKSTKTFEGALGNLEAAAINTGTALIEWIGKDNITNAINAATSAVEWLTNNLDTVVPVIGAAAGAFVAFKTALTIQSLVTGAVTAFKGLVTAIQGASGAMGVLNAVMGANPVGIIVAAIAALVAGFVVLWNTSDGFRAFWQGLWEQVQAAFQAFMDWITPMIQSLGQFFTDLWTRISTAAQTAWDTITSVVQVGIMFIGEIINAAVQILMVPWNFIWENFGTFLTSAWETIKGVVQAGINFVSNIIQTVLGVVRGIWSTVWGAISTTASTIWNTIKSVITTAINAARNVISNVLNTISSIWSSVWGTVSNVASTIWNGIKSTITTVINTVSSTVSNVVNGIRDTITSVFNGIWGTATSVWNSIKSAIETPINAARDAVKGAIDAIKGFFNFSWSLPPLKLPHISISGEFSLMPPKVPKFGISWYKEGGILTQPTIFGAQGGTLLGGGEAGHEAVLPIDKLRGYVEDSMMNVVGRFDLDPIIDAVEDLAERVISIEIDGKQLARATASHADRVNGSRQQLMRRGLSQA